jgi:hypothetical protein
MLVLSGGRNVASNWFNFGSNMNLDAVIGVISKWDLSGIAVATTAKTAPVAWPMFISRVAPGVFIDRLTSGRRILPQRHKWLI